MCLARARASKNGGHLGEKNDKLELFSLLLTYLSLHRLILATKMIEWLNLILLF